MRYDLEKRAFLIKKFSKLNNSTLVQRAWRSEFKNLKAPDHKTILNLVSKFDKTGSVADLSRKSDKPSEKRENAKIVIEEAITRNPSLSLSKLSVCSGISQTLTRSILRDDLNLKPYKPQESQKLEASDYPKRLEFAEWFLSLPNDTAKFLVCSDEAYFYLTESINKQNNRKWLNTRPLESTERPLQIV